MKYGFRPILIGRPDTPIDDIDKIRQKISEYKPSVFVNASAYNDVEGAEDDFDNANIVNAIGPMLMAKAAKEADIPIIHISTDYVFSGEKNTHYKESDETNPLNKYGMSKLSGEENVRLNNDKHVIIRTSWVFSPYSNNFLKTILNKAKQSSEPINMANDQYNIPTSGFELAKIILQISQKIASKENNKDHYGIFHVTSNGVINRGQYAKYIMDKAKELGLSHSEINYVAADFFKSKAKRPKYSALDKNKVVDTFGFAIVNWDKAIDEVMNVIAMNNLNSKSEE